MALTDKERDHIVEEETLRFETRRKLNQEQGGCCHGGHGHKHGCGCKGWLGWIVAAVLAAILIFHCSPCRRACPMGGPGFMPGCRAMMQAPDQAPAADAAKAPASAPAKK